MHLAVWPIPSKAPGHDLLAARFLINGNKNPELARGAKG